MIIGISPGRSGSASLRTYLNCWHEFKTLHSKFYSQDPENWLNRMKQMCHTYEKTEGDISFDHINSIEHWHEQGADIIVLMRDRDKVVSSWLKRGAHRPMMRLFPEHDFTTKEGLERFYDWFYDEVFKHEDKVMIISPEQLPIVENTWSNFEKELQNRGIEADTFDETIRDDDNNGVIFDFTNGKDGEPL